jgi:SAM-dependent methyltransferase
MARDDDRVWRLDELAHAGQEHLDALYVAGYDTKSATDWSEDVAALRGLGIGSASTVVDLGAGTGAFAEAIAPHVRRVVSVDVSPAMVAALRARGLEAVQAGFLTYEHRGDPADAVMTRNALHHLPDFWKVVALSRVASMLRFGGVLLLQDLVYSFDPAEAASAIEARLRAAPTDPAKGWTAEQLAEHVRTRLRTRRKRSARCQAAEKAQYPPALPPPIAQSSGSSVMLRLSRTGGRISVNRNVA